VIRYEVYQPQPLPWRTIIGRCRPGGLKLNSIKVSDQGRYAIILKKFTKSGWLSDKFIKIYDMLFFTRQIGDERGQQNRFFPWGDPAAA